jgi:hypothetical protein
MNTGAQIGFEDWLSRRATLRVAVGLWVAGVVLAGASALHMNHEGAGRESNEAPASGTAISSGAAPAATESDGVLVMPLDTVVVHEAPVTGVTLKQKPQ